METNGRKGGDMRNIEDRRRIESGEIFQITTTNKNVPELMNQFHTD
jgi:hypothetical protein